MHYSNDDAFHLLQILCLGQCFDSKLSFIRLSDGGMLVSLDGSSYTTYMKEESNNYRIVIGNRTCIFEKENDPTLLRWAYCHHDDCLWLVICLFWSLKGFHSDYFEQKIGMVNTCRSPSAGKLLNYSVEDGAHVYAGDAYAEIEVMKMVMELRVTETGWQVIQTSKNCFNANLWSFITW